MRHEVKRAKTDSDRRFLRFVWPIISRRWPHLAGFRLMSASELQTYKVLVKLDQDCNIDFLAESPNGRDRIAIASRVQANFDYRTFTIRASRANGEPTELPKMLKAIKSGYVHAGYQTHGYVQVWPDGAEFPMRIFGANVAPIYDFYVHHRELCPLKRVYDGNEMLVIKVEDLREHGVYVDEIELPDRRDVETWLADREHGRHGYAPDITFEEWAACRQIAGLTWEGEAR